MKINTQDVKVWFTSDTHFRHRNILNFYPKTRKGSQIDEHDRFLIKSWQEQVSPNDLVFHLGDFSFGDAAEIQSILEQLPGQKILILGNHDKIIWSNRSLHAYFYKITEYARVSIDGQVVVMFHFPIYEWDMMHRGGFHLFGHMHGAFVPVEGRCMDVGIDTRPEGDMKLWSWDEVKRILLSKPIRGHH